MFLAIIPMAAQDNGIAVGKPKVFDNRTLTIMLGQLNSSLASATVVDPTALAAALNLFQGLQTNSAVTTLNASYTAAAALSSGGNGVSTSNTGSGNTGSSSGSGTGSPGSASPAAATLPTGIQNILSTAAFSPQFGNSAGDQLSEQVNLTYQIFNLRMLLERSLSDRLLNDGQPRRQAVLGFNVSIDPAFAERDAVAIVEVTIAGPEIELVGLMPQEKTYNSAALNTKAKSFGGTATARLYTVSLGAQRQSQVFYLFRDNDTLSFQRMSPALGNVDFGWQFRPVLGRRSISPGMRQMFAIISLPESDDPASATPTSLNVHVRTYWRHYDHGTLTAYYRASVLKRLEVASSPNNWGIALRRVNNRNYYGIPIHPSKYYEDHLGAIVDSADWLPTDEGNGTLLIKGKNFFTGTSVKIGPAIFTEGNGLSIQSDQTMILNTSLVSAAQGDGVVTGRYGKAVPLAPNTYSAPGVLPVRIASISVYPGGLSTQCGYQTSCVDIELTKDWGLTSWDLPHVQPTVSYNGALLVGQQLIEDRVNAAHEHSVVVHMKMPTATLGNATGIFTVKFPFQGPNWIAKGSFMDPLAVDLQRIDVDSKSTLMISNRNTKFNGPWKAILDQVYTVDEPDPRQPHSISLLRVIPCADGTAEPNCHLLQLTVDKSILDAWKKITMVAPDGNLRIFDVPASGSTPAPGKRLSPPKLITPVVRQAQIRNITYTGQSLDQIKRVYFNSKDLAFVAAADGKSLTVSLTSDVTTTPGEMQLTLQVDAQTVLSAPITILPVQGASPADAAKKTN